MKKLDKPQEKERDLGKDEPKIKVPVAAIHIICLLSNIWCDLFCESSIEQLLKKPEISEENDGENPKEKAKKPEKLTKEDRAAGSGDHKRRQNIDHKEDRGRKSVTPHLIWGFCFLAVLGCSGWWTFNTLHCLDFYPLSELKNMDGRSLGSVIQIRTEIGRRSVGRERRSASSVGMKSGREGENARMQRTCSGGKKMSLKKKENVMWTRRSVKTWEIPQTRWWNRPKTTEGMKKENGCETRWGQQLLRPSDLYSFLNLFFFPATGPTCNPVVPTWGQEPQSAHGSRTRVGHQEAKRRHWPSVWQRRRLSGHSVVMTVTAVMVCCCGVTASSSPSLRWLIYRASCAWMRQKNGRNAVDLKL